MLDSAEEDNVVSTRGTEEDFETRDKRRRIPGQPKKSFEATQMWDSYQEIARRIVIGQMNTEIANDLGVTPQMVSYVRNSPIVMEKIDTLQTAADGDTVNIASRIKSLAPHAMKVIEDLIITGQVGTEKIPAKLRANHAEKLLDRAGHAAPREVRSLNLTGHYTSDELEEIKARARNAATASSIVVEDDVESAVFVTVQESSNAS